MAVSSDEGAEVREVGVEVLEEGLGISDEGRGVVAFVVFVIIAAGRRWRREVVLVQF